MSEDREVLREVWQGRVPACFNLSSEDVHTMAIPEPYYLMLPRLSYIMIVTDKVKFLWYNLITFLNLSTSSLISPSFQGDPTMFHKGIFLKQTHHIKI